MEGERGKEKLLSYMVTPTCTVLNGIQWQLARQGKTKIFHWNWPCPGMQIFLAPLKDKHSSLLFLPSLRGLGIGWKETNALTFLPLGALDMCSSVYKIREGYVWSYKDTLQEKEDNDSSKHFLLIPRKTLNQSLSLWSSAFVPKDSSNLPRDFVDAYNKKNETFFVCTIAPAYISPLSIQTDDREALFARGPSDKKRKSIEGVCPNQSVLYAQRRSIVSTTWMGTRMYIRTHCWGPRRILCCCTFFPRARLIPYIWTLILFLGIYPFVIKIRMIQQIRKYCAF